MQEEDVYQWWQYYGRSGKSVTSGGHILSVKHSGVLNTARGPDFIAARFELDGVTYQGDVECHLRRSDWYAHKHHLDKAYRQVVLHLVAYPGELLPVKSRWNDQSIYTILLPEPDAYSAFPAKTCKPGRSYEKNLRSRLTHLALQRFQQKVHVFIESLSRENYCDVFFINYFRVLGYPANANSFQLLAERLGWLRLTNNLSTDLTTPADLFAVFAGQAGFIPVKPADKYTEAIQSKYVKYKSLLPDVPLESSLWQTAGVRPFNHPHFRLAAGLQLLSYYKFRLIDELYNILQMRIGLNDCLHSIFKVFNLAPDPYWQIHYALGRRRRGSHARVCLGRARITELLMNTVLPLAAAQAVISGSDGYFSYLQSLYLALPLVSNYGLINSKLPWSQRCLDAMPFQAVNQALLHLLTGSCRLSLCDTCPVDRAAYFA